jgi:type IX secretion system PorP/SprF family membrane protein
MHIRKRNFNNGQYNTNLLNMKINRQLKKIYNLMKPYSKHILFLLFILFININLISQDAHFSQYYAAKFSLAPSFAGTTEGGRVISIFRDQWPLLKSTYITYGFALDYAFPKLMGGLGIFAMQDYSNGGGIVVTNVGMQYSYAVKLKHIWSNQKWQFRPGFQFNSINKRLDLNNIVFGSQLSFDETNRNNSVNIESSNINIYESAISVLFNSDIAWFGASVSHLPLSKKSFSGESYVSPVKFISFGGVCLKTIQGRLLYDKDYIYFSYLFKYQNNFKQLDIGGYWSNKSLTAGLWYRGLPFFKNSFGEYNNAALIFILGKEFKHYSIGYSFDYSLSKIGSFTGGAHEISMVFLLNQGKNLKKKKYKMIPSPKF